VPAETVPFDDDQKGEAMRLENKVAVITGAGAGLGREAALLFAREGASIVATDIEGDRAEETAQLIRDAGGAARAQKTDVTSEAEVKGAIQSAVDEFGKLDVLYNNAGIPVPGFGTVPFWELSEADLRKVIDVNLLGVMFGCKHAVPPMRDNGGGAIVVTSSAGGLAAYPGFAAYCAAKGGVNQLVHALAVDLGQFNIRVNAICPTHGMSANFAMAPGDPVLGKSYEEMAGDWDPHATPIPLKKDRPPSLLDNAYGALFFASDESAYMSGVVMPTCDGGTLSRVALMF
jgi:NAD(P)-dependent dehydrogenase (short-subunit alcohol dehydrogenase family)